MSADGWFVKLQSSIVNSSVWVGQPSDVKVLWITMLAMSAPYSDGRVLTSILGLARNAGLTVAATEAALAIFLAPDPFSSSQENAGRRIEAIDGGWRILNASKYRESRTPTQAKAVERQKRHRGRHALSRSVTSVTPEGEGEGEKEREGDPDSISPTGEMEREACTAHAGASLASPDEPEATSTAPRAAVPPPRSSERAESREREEMAVPAVTLPAEGLSLTPPPSPASSKRKRASGAAGGSRGARLPEGWRPTPGTYEEAARDAGLDEADVERELSVFADHWRARPGKDGVKLDWDATWRNWLRRAPSFQRGPGRSQPIRGGSYIDRAGIPRQAVDGGREWNTEDL